MCISISACGQDVCCQLRRDRIRGLIIDCSRPMALITPALSHPGVIVYAVAARDKARAAAFAKTHNIPVVKESYDGAYSPFCSRLGDAEFSSCPICRVTVSSAGLRFNQPQCPPGQT